MIAKPSQQDSTLAKVAPDRRKFLGMLLAGTAALPLICSTSLEAEGTQHPQKPVKATSAAPLKNSSAAPLKNSSGQVLLKNSTGSAPLKNTTGSAGLKNSTSAVQLKNQTGSAPLKNSTGQFKNSTGAGAPKTQ